MTRDLFLGGKRIAKGGDNGNHCVGITFEVFWRALEEEPKLSVKQAKKMLRLWFVPKDGGKGSAEALPAFGYGERVDLEDALPGDFAQVWLHGGMGHSRSHRRHAVLVLPTVDGWDRDHRVCDRGRARRDRPRPDLYCASDGRSLRTPRSTSVKTATQVSGSLKKPSMTSP